MNRLAVSILCAAGASGLLITSSPAEACAPIYPGGTAALPIPADGATDLPLNTKIWLFASRDIGTVDAAGVQIVDGSGTQVAFTASNWEALSGAKYLVLHPNSDLMPQTHYTVRTQSVDLTSFTTGSARVDTAPAKPEVIDRGSREADPPEPIVSSGSCGPSDGSAWFKLRSEAAIVLADVDGRSAFVDQEISGTVSDVETTEDDVYFSILASNPNDTRTIRFAALDAAGNFSGWTDPITVQFTGNSGPCACSAIPSGSLAPAALGMLVLLGRVRRQRRTSAD